MPNPSSDIVGPFASMDHCLNFKSALEEDGTGRKAACETADDGRVFARVTQTAPSPTGAVLGAAAGGAIGAAAGGPVGAALGAAVGAMAGAVVAPSGAASGATSDLASALRDAAAKVGVDPLTLGAIAFVESSFRIDAKNPNSSAFGLFQFLDGTWAGVVGRHGAALGVRADQRRDLRAQCLMGAAFLKDNATFLRNRLGRDPSAAECYAAHFFGVGTAARLLSGGSAIPADQALGNSADRVIRANESIFRTGGRIRTVGEVMALFESKISRGTEKARDLLT